MEEAASTPILVQESVSSADHSGDVELLGQGPSRAEATSVPATRPPSARPWPALLAGLTFAVDVVAVTLSYLLAKAVAHGVGWDSGKPIHINAPIFAPVAIWPAVFAIFGLYDLRRPTATAEFQRLLNALLMSVLLVVLVTFVIEVDVSRGFVLWLLGFSLVTVVAGRLATRRLTHTLNARDVTGQVTLIAGTNDEARALARTLQRRPWMGYRVCGFVDVTPSVRARGRQRASRPRHSRRHRSDQ